MNENAKLDRLIRRLNNIYIEDIGKPLRDIDVSELVGFLGENMPRAIEKMHEAVDRQLRALLKMELLAGRGTRIQPEELNALLIQFKSKSRYNTAFVRFAERVSRKLINAADEAMFQRLDFSALANHVGIAELSSMKRIVTTESLAAINWGREQNYSLRDKYNDYRYKWAIRKDIRTTPQCLSIDAQVSEAGGSMKLDELKKLIDRVAVDFDPKWRVRDWVPHYNCRSLLLRTVEIEKGNTS